VLKTRQILLHVQGLYKTCSQGRWWEKRFNISILENVNLVLEARSTLALIGESGAGKTTLAMCLAGLEQADRGVICFDGIDLPQVNHNGKRSIVRDIQLIFQDSASALNPRMSAVQIIEEPLRVGGNLPAKERRERAFEALEHVGIPNSWANRRSHELSGGQRQRLAIARAVVTRPKLLILDEPLAGLDLSIQGQVTNMLLDLQTAYGLSYLYISHNLELVSRIADDIAVMHQGKIVVQAAPPVILTSSMRWNMAMPVVLPPASQSRSTSAGA
jgi:ABC-type dipeptide/oligopeptide/nickel transport system ATPase subunit